MAVTFVAGANNKANSTGPTVVVPAGCAVNDVILVSLSQNNTDAVNSTPSGLTQIVLNTTTASFPARLYWGVVDGSTITAGGTLTWGLSATRAWATCLYAARGVDTASPIHNSNTAAAATSPAVMPSLVTTVSSWLVEFAAGKSNGTIISSWTAPSGWTARQTAAAFSTFSGSIVAADLDAGTAAAGTYGSETYTPSSTAGAYVTHAVALTPASTTVRRRDPQVVNRAALNRASNW